MIVSVKIINKAGLHARPAAAFVQLANKFKSQVKVKKDDIEVNGKSILGMMMLGASVDSKITLKITGSDEKEMCEALIKLISDKFNED